MASFDKNPNKNNGSGDNLPMHPSTGTDITEPRCKVCNSSYRRDIDRYLVMGMTHAEIARYYEVLGEIFTRKGIGTHAKKHLTLYNRAIRNLIEKKAEEALLDVEAGTDILLTKRSLLEIMMHKGYESIMSGMSLVEPKDIISVIDKLDKMESEQQSVAVDEMVRDFRAFADAVKFFVSEDEWIKIFEHYKRNLDMEKLLPKALSEPVDVEIIEEEDDD